MIDKIIDKFLTLIAFISTACLAVHATPLYLFRKGASGVSSEEVVPLAEFVGRVLIGSVFVLVTTTMFLALSVASVLLLLELFSVKIKPVQNKDWTVFAAVGYAPILPFAVLTAWYIIMCYVVIMPLKYIIERFFF
ncbi:hypothetical protein [Fibrobacter sp. UWB11]|uniref:hypothetical protein n=1 Tax=Fibrobacter sp. UWB11 TaxID=1896202 RepID=UPI0009297D50|nr:hypothetical protein [Fibrobacter sp. UWB11]SIO45265.1 hypothetical protein SAMN05720758_3012 [Fibrobacter sp. UWB11]